MGRIRPDQTDKLRNSTPQRDFGIEALMPQAERWTVPHPLSNVAWPLVHISCHHVHTGTSRSPRARTGAANTFALHYGEWSGAVGGLTQELSRRSRNQWHTLLHYLEPHASFCASADADLGSTQAADRTHARTRARTRATVRHSGFKLNAGASPVPVLQLEQKVLMRTDICMLMFRPAMTV